MHYATHSETSLNFSYLLSRALLGTTFLTNLINANLGGRMSQQSCNMMNLFIFAECSLVCDFWKYLKTWFLRAFEFCINFTALDILLGIPNFLKIRTLIFLIL